MKKHVYFTLLAIALLASCSQVSYPNQSEDARKAVPKATSYFTAVPLVHQVGDVKYIHDVSNNAFILFKGSEDTLLQHLIEWVSANVGQKNDGDLAVAKYTQTPIAPFTLFTKKQLKAMSKKDRQIVLELAQYKTFSITVEQLLYMDELPIAEQNLARGLIQPEKVSSTVNQTRTQIAPPTRVRPKVNRTPSQQGGSLLNRDDPLKGFTPLSQ